jgi:hypothetical protein
MDSVLISVSEFSSFRNKVTRRLESVDEAQSFTNRFNHCEAKKFCGLESMCGKTINSITDSVVLNLNL